MKLLVPIAAVLLLSACKTLDDKPDFLIGSWGGAHAGIIFEGGLAKVDFDCASGTIDAPVYPAKDGTFSAKGSVRTGTGGPVRVGQIFRSQPASYSGRVDKQAMSLTVTLEDGGIAGPFSLTQGTPPQLTRCL